jgi:hypothetical protein
VPALPDGKVGPALMGTSTSAGPVLFTEDGGRYALTNSMDGSLSPDGRWLLDTFGQRFYALRDLTADGPVRPLDVDATSFHRWQPVTWSPDSRWLLLWRQRDGNTNDYQRVEVATGRAVTGTLGAGEQLLAVLSSGDLLAGPTTATTSSRPDPVTLRVLDPNGPKERGRVTLKDTVLAADRVVENRGSAPALVTPDGRSVVLTLNSAGDLAVLATVDLRTGDLVRGQQLPAGWRPVVVTTRGIVVTAEMHDGHQPFDTLIGVVEPNAPTTRATGAAEPTVMARVVGGGVVMLRGGAGWG